MIFSVVYSGTKSSDSAHSLSIVNSSSLPYSPRPVHNYDMACLLLFIPVHYFPVSVVYSRKLFSCICGFCLFQHTILLYLLWFIPVHYSPVSVVVYSSTLFSCICCLFQYTILLYLLFILVPHSPLSVVYSSTPFTCICCLFQYTIHLYLLFIPVHYSARPVHIRTDCSRCRCDALWSRGKCRLFHIANIVDYAMWWVPSIESSPVWDTSRIKTAY